jgi:hypothetical protein
VQAVGGKGTALGGGARGQWFELAAGHPWQEVLLLPGCVRGRVGEVVSRRDAGRDKVGGKERDVGVEKRCGGGGEKAGVVNVWESVSREARCVGG